MNCKKYKIVQFLMMLISGLMLLSENLYEKVNKHETRISFIEGKTDIEQKRD